MGAFVKAARANEIPPGAGKAVESSGKSIAIFNVAGVFYASDGTCTHRGGPLSEGDLHGKEVTCPWHGAVFDVTTGAVLSPPAPQEVSRYATRIEGGDVEVEL